MDKNRYTVLVIIIFVFSVFCQQLAAQNVITIKDNFDEINLADKVQYYSDSLNETSFQNINKYNAFIDSKSSFLNFKITKATVWLKFKIQNLSDYRRIKLCIDQLNINDIELFREDSTALSKVGDTHGTDFKIINDYHKVPSFVFDLNVSKGETKTFYLKVNNKGQLFIPLYLRNTNKLNDVWLKKFVIFGIYAGIILALLFYNLFLAVSIKDDRKSYVWYLFHSIFILLTQASFQGFTTLFLWPYNHFMANQGIYLFTCLVSMSGIEYAKSFLQTKNNFPRIHKIISLFHPIYLIIIIFSVMGEIGIAYSIIQPMQLLIAFVLLFSSLSLVLKGSRLAIFYFISWSALFVAIIVYILTDVAVFPYNIFTSQILLYGSAVQVVLLSIAQADKYNILKIQEQKAQEQAFQAALLNEKMTKEQNVVLERKVKERTRELENANTQLTDTLTVLKETQIQLVEKEKMSSLGQLTAGIAHEINNPINFVSSNINPLKRDVKMLVELMDNVEGIAKAETTQEEKVKAINKLKANVEYDYLKTEIDFLLKGIGEGASRTAEIVKGLKVFSRSDEFETKFADVHEGINSTLVLVNNQLGGKIKIEKHYNAPTGVIEHYPGKLNQVFMNLFSNAIYAITKKWGEKLGGLITVETKVEGDKFIMTFKDNGIGMDAETVNKMFDPFFTTKEVGEGTGLGMSIVYKTIEMHEGKISVSSVVGEGTEFTIAIPNRLNR